jgi:hypothetical protein
MVCTGGTVTEYTKGIFILFYSSYELILCVWLGEEGPLPFRESKGEVGMNEKGGMVL